MIIDDHNLRKQEKGSQRDKKAKDSGGQESILAQDESTQQAWQWRMEMAKAIVERLECEEYSVKAVYLIGSTKTGKACQGSDIDLVIHMNDDSAREKLSLWLDGWSQCLDELNHAKTGEKCGGLLDIHFVSDEDFEENATWAAQLNNIDDPPLQLYPDEKTT